MYKIIGADEKEYGPITGGQIRQWIAENRINAQTRARAEADPEWKPLSLFPEFADVLGTGPAAAPPPVGALGGGERTLALQSVKGPAIALMVTASLNILLGFWQIVSLSLGGASADLEALPQFNDPQVQKILHLMYGPVGIASTAFSIIMGVLVLVGALKMRALRNYPWAMTAAILSLLPCVTPCCFIGLPFGIWALIVLNRAEVKSQFG